MKAKLYDDDVIRPILINWLAAEPGRAKNDLFMEFWQASKPLREHLVDKYSHGWSMNGKWVGEGVFDDWHSILKVKTLKALRKYKPSQSSYSFFYTVWGRCIQGELRKLSTKSHWGKAECHSPVKETEDAPWSHDTPKYTADSDLDRVAYENGYYLDGYKNLVDPEWTSEAEEDGLTVFS